ncbi:MAG: methyltransferase domain-containing protein [Acidobacteria bacterium]|nr:methyltransferase domain-containing protein [Acidobacteriota bacterium]
MNDRTFKAADAHRLEDPERLKWLPPDDAVRALSIAPGMVIADVGAGTGYFTLPFARAVAPGGRVLAVDLQPGMLSLLGAKLEAPGAPGNVELLEGTASRTGIAGLACDLFFLANIWHELDDAEEVLAEAARTLKRAGRIAILDWRPDVDRPPDFAGGGGFDAGRRRVAGAAGGGIRQAQLPGCRGRWLRGLALA